MHRQLKCSHPCVQWKPRLKHLSAILLALCFIFFLSRIPYYTSSYQATQKDEAAPATDLPLDTPSTAIKYASKSQILLEIPIEAPNTKAQLHVVVAHHSEEPYYIKTWIDGIRALPFVQSLGIHITIYTKGSSPSVIQEATDADEVISLPNVGREGSTYLHHILRTYENPPLFTLFAQAYVKGLQVLDKDGRKDPERPPGTLTKWIDDRLHTKWDNSTGFMSLATNHSICHCGHCTDMGRDDYYPLWSPLYALLQGTLCEPRKTEGQILSFNGQFIVSRKRILGREKRTYAFLKELVDAPKGHWIHDEKQPEWVDAVRGRSKPSDPKFGHTLERMWHTLWWCERWEDVVDCEEGDGGEGGCSCRDL